MTEATMLFTNYGQLTKSQLIKRKKHAVWFPFDKFSYLAANYNWYSSVCYRR